MKHLMLGKVSVALVAGSLAIIAGAAVFGAVSGFKMTDLMKPDAVDIISKERLKEKS